MAATHLKTLVLEESCELQRHANFTSLHLAVVKVQLLIDIGLFHLSSIRALELLSNDPDGDDAKPSPLTGIC